MFFFQPARLLLDDWKGEEDGDWLDQQRLDDFDEVDKMLVQALEIT